MLGATYYVTVLCLLIQALNLYADGCVDEMLSICKGTAGVDLKEVLIQQASKKELPNEDFLNKYCDKGKTFSSCLFASTKFCESEEFRQIGFLINLTNQVCNTTSAFRKAYVNNVDCVNINVPVISQCATGAADFLDSQLGEVNETIVEVRHLMNCLVYYVIRYVCIQGIIQDECGVEGGDFAQKLFKDISTYVEERCPKEAIRDIVGENINKWKWKKEEKQIQVYML